MGSQKAQNMAKIGDFKVFFVKNDNVFLGQKKEYFF